MNNNFRRLWAAIGHGQSLWGLLPSPIAALAVAVLGFLGGYNIYVLAAGFLLTLAVVEFILWRARSKGQTIGYLALLSLVLVGALTWGTVRSLQHREEYKLSFDGITVLRDGHRLPTGENQVTAIQPQIDVGNHSEIPIYYIIERRFGKIGTATTPMDNPGAKVTKLLPGHGVYIDTRHLRRELSNGAYHSGEVEYVLKYGREQNNLDRRFTYKAKFQFFLCPVSALLCGQVTTTEEEVRNEKIIVQGE